MTKSVNKIVILLVALLMCLTVVFAACSKDNFTPVKIPAKGEVGSNGGIAVTYGDYLYYVNGYTADVSAENTYSDDVKDNPRIGSVVRIKLAEIETLIAIYNDDDLTSSKKTENIAAAVRGGTIDGVVYEGAETVIPKIYYSGNTTATQFTGIYIFNDRIYVTTPSDELTPNGDPMTDQLKLMSFNLGGGDRKEHFTFTNNAAQIWLDVVDGKLVATYLMDNVLHVLDVANGKKGDKVVTKDYSSKLKHINNTVSGVNWDKQGKAVFFIDEFGSLCKLAFGATEYEVIVENDTYKSHGDHIESGKTSYTIKFVNDGVVYYTKATGANSATDNIVLYRADGTNKDVSVLPTNSVSATAWKDNKLIITKSIPSGNKTFYGIWAIEVVEKDGVKTYVEEEVILPGENDSNITINKIEGDVLYYTVDSVSYTVNIADAIAANGVDQGSARAKSLASTTGWAEPDLVKVGSIYYVISLKNDSVTLTTFDPENIKGDVATVALTLTPVPAE